MFLGIHDKEARHLLRFSRVTVPTRRRRLTRRLGIRQWVALVTQYTQSGPRDRFVGVSCTLAAKLLAVSRSRVAQLIRSGKLTVVDVYDGSIRIGHLVTLSSIDHRRRTVRPRRTQWRSARS